MRRYAIGLVLVAACHHQGTGIGSIQAPSSEVEAPETAVFSWSYGADPSRGKINARLSDGTELRGTFVQVKDAIQVTQVDAYYNVWNTMPWTVWQTGTAMPQTDYITGYSKTVFARLRSLNGVRMQCKFELADPVKGLRRGADGKCMLSDRERATYSTMTARVPG